MQIKKIPLQLKTKTRICGSETYNNSKVGLKVQAHCLQERRQATAGVCITQGNAVSKHAMQVQDPDPGSPVEATGWAGVPLPQKKR